MKRIDLTKILEEDKGFLLHALQEAYDEIDKLEKALSIINSTHFPKE